MKKLRLRSKAQIVALPLEREAGSHREACGERR